MQEEIVLRHLKTLPEMRSMQEVEQSVWNMESPVPIHQTLTVAKNGGILIGAFHGEQMVGMLYSFPGFLNGQVYLCSHMMGIKSGWRHRGIGERLKRAQAEAALAHGYRLITWTYDPLETANGYLNVGKLGVICSTYIEDCYGDMSDQLNQGLPSDRFQVEWWIDRNRPPLPQGDEQDLLRWQPTAGGLPQPVQVVDNIPDAQILSVAVPAYFQDIKPKDMELAKTWRQATRQVFTRSFAAGWAVAGFRCHRGEPVHEYLLVQRRLLSLPQAPWQKGE